jgi:dTDP-4-amino-4,6-dideoxygalactose transaminase
MIQPLDLKKQIAPLRPQIDAAIKKVLDNANFILGQEVIDFEKHVEQYTGAKFAIGCSNGTDAIRLALVALGIKPSDEVACPAFTYFATAGAAVSIGAKPVFVDIDLDTYTMSLESLEAVLKKRKGKIKAVIPVHLYGQCADMDGVLKLARKYHLKVIEDTAQAFGAEYKGKKAGTIGDCGTVSFYPGKNLGAFGDAGMVLTNNKGTASRMRILLNQGNKDKYYHIITGFNHRLDTLQAAILDVRLNYLDGWNKLRQENAAYYNAKLAGFEVITPFVPTYTTHIYHQYVLRLKQPAKGLIGYLHQSGIDARVFYPVALHLQKCFKGLGYKKGSLIYAEQAAGHTLAIPVHPDLTIEEKDYIIEKIREGVQTKN